MMDNTMCNDEIDVAIKRNSEINYPTCRPCHISLTRCDDVPRTSITTKIKSLEPKPKRLRIPVFNFIQKLNIRCIQYVVGGTNFWKVRFKEEDLLSNESLTCYSDDSDEIEIKVTNFTVIAECGHLCPLETIEKRN
uniref:Uncharacterized protein n=1 Tax=Romanomermis culicivorax TaxID=13658 RepID=A0A915KNV0_ROMCU